jgi:hypothetical protein
MKTTLHRASERGIGEHGWLSTRYSFSFADWYNPEKMGFGALRVINDDRIAADSGFGQHAHKDMEIITIVMKGAVTHQDSMGNKGAVPAGDVQAMSAGTGVVHAEYNDSPDEPLELFQIWIEPKEKNVAPRYAQRAFGLNEATPGITLLVGPDGSSGLPVHQDAYLSYAVLEDGVPMSYVVQKAGNGVYVFVIGGAVSVAGETLDARDALGIEGESTIQLIATENSTALIIEVPMG